MYGLSGALGSSETGSEGVTEERRSGLTKTGSTTLFSEGQRDRSCLRVLRIERLPNVQCGGP